MADQLTTVGTHRTFNNAAPASPEWGRFMATQAQIIFSYSFAAGGLWIGETGYKPGEYTKFEWKPKDDEPVIMEKAYLAHTKEEGVVWRSTLVEKGTGANTILGSY